MKKKVALCLLPLITLLLFSCSGTTESGLMQRAAQISKSEMQSVTQFLGDDLLEGRAPATRGGELAEAYLQSLYKFMDLDPGYEGAFFQPVELKAFSTWNIKLEAKGESLEYIEDIVGNFVVEEASGLVDGPAVFVGFGIKADTWDWDDYKDVDMKDKVVITRVNDPGYYLPDIFEGKILTYYGRWTYHIEEAARRGAAAVLLIHTDESAGYGWKVPVNSWTGEQLYIDSDLQSNLKFAAWVKESSLKELLTTIGIDLEELYEKSLSRDFHPVDLDMNIRISGENSYRSVVTNNVLAEIPGKTEERIVLSAHIDHLGMAEGMEGDNIFNGAIDNGTAVAAMMLAAKILKEHQDELYYSITILACQAEESGLLGSKYYAVNTDRSNIIANINFESTPVWEASNSIMGIGARFSDFEDLIKELAAEEDLGYSNFSLSNQGLFYRSDQFSFARFGIPAVWISAGEDEVDGARNYTEFWGKDYHTVRDEYSEDWSLDGMKQTIYFALKLIDHINKTKVPMEWKSDLPFPMENQ